MRISLGCHVKHAALPVPDIRHSPSQIEGAVKRIGCAMPPPDRAKMRRFKRFVNKFLETHFPNDRFGPDENFEFDNYIEKTNYPRFRKEKLREINSEIYNIKGKSTNVGGFTKDENYPEYKHFRGIMTREDDYKTRVGPFFQAFDKKLFSKACFIKKIPVHKRPAWLTEKFKFARDIFCTDFSSFEATFGRQMMKIERHIYSWFLKFNPHHDEIMKLYDQGIYNLNLIRYKDFNLRIMCRRMSGEMNTSGGNGLMNMMMTYFILHESGNSLDLATAFEGDDGEVEVDVAFPTSQDYADLGANIKIEIPSGPSTASFCGLIYDVESMDNVTDPIDSLMSFGWTTKQYLDAGKNKLNALLRSKSLSLLYEYPACPILRELALYGLRMTKHIDSKYLQLVISKQKMSMYDREIMLEAIKNHDLAESMKKEITHQTRYLVETKFNIPIKTQIEVETYLKNLTVLQPLDLPQLSHLFHPDTVSYYSDYVIENYIGQTFVKHPGRPYRIWYDCNANNPDHLAGLVPLILNFEDIYY